MWSKALTNSLHPFRNRQRDKPAAAFDSLERVPEDILADGIQYNINILHHICQRLLRIVDDGISSQITHKLHIAGRMRRNDSRTPPFGELDRILTDAPRSPGNENGLPRLQMGGIKQRLPGYQPGHRYTGSFLMRQSVWFEREIRYGRGDILTIGLCFARKTWHPIHFITNRELRHAFAQRDDRACNVPAQDIREVPGCNAGYGEFAARAIHLGNARSSHSPQHFPSPRFSALNGPLHHNFHTTK